MKSGAKTAVKLARGGKVEPPEPKPKEDERTKEMAEEEEEGHARGGAVKRKAGGQVPGRAAGGRLDRRARGGRMTPKSPFSGATVKSMPYEGKLSGVETGGKGRLRP